MFGKARTKLLNVYGDTIVQHRILIETSAINLAAACWMGLAKELDLSTRHLSVGCPSVDVACNWKDYVGC